MGQTETPLIDDQPRQRHIDLPEWFKASFLDLREDLFEALQSDKRALVVYFGQENCAYCEALLETNFGDPEIARYTQAHFDVVPIDIWGDLPVTDIQGETSPVNCYVKAGGKVYKTSQEIKVTVGGCGG